jgi:hypothetical protein
MASSAQDESAQQQQQQLLPSRFDTVKVLLVLVELIERTLWCGGLREISGNVEERIAVLLRHICDGITPRQVVYGHLWPVDHDPMTTKRHPRVWYQHHAKTLIEICGPYQQQILKALQTNEPRAIEATTAPNNLENHPLELLRFPAEILNMILERVLPAEQRVFEIYRNCKYPNNHRFLKKQYRVWSPTIKIGFSKGSSGPFSFHGVLGSCRRLNAIFLTMVSQVPAADFGIDTLPPGALLTINSRSDSLDAIYFNMNGPLNTWGPVPLFQSSLVAACAKFRHVAFDEGYLKHAIKPGAQSMTRVLRTRLGRPAGSTFVWQRDFLPSFLKLIPNLKTITAVKSSKEERKVFVGDPFKLCYDIDRHTQLETDQNATLTEESSAMLPTGVTLRFGTLERPQETRRQLASVLLKKHFEVRPDTSRSERSILICVYQDTYPNESQTLN